ncbi:MAG: hypothetical protein LBS24_07380 [Clostridiales Family XIII bacterium]|jgi:hypothetical protein|nr:hypothetical protein [Clostridiales Family XIII bacterium]
MSVSKSFDATVQIVTSAVSSKSVLSGDGSGVTTATYIKAVYDALKSIESAEQAENKQNGG